MAKGSSHYRLMLILENVRDMKRNPEKILNSLTQHSSDLEYKFERLYRILFNEEMYYIAYQRIYAKQGNMTKGVDGKTVDGFSISHIEQLIDTLRNETYQPKPSQRVYIPKKNGKMRPLGIPSFMDKLLQEVIRMILEAIYEGSFENTSHGFRPQRSPQTALSSIQKSFTGTKWFIEGDIKGFFDNIDHEVLIAILSERISDNRFIRLIRKFLNAGYVEDWVFHKSYSGTPQGGIISPILANIYLDKFDKYIKEYITKFNKGKRRKENPIAKQLGHRKAKLVAKLRNTVDETKRKQLFAEIRETVNERLKYPAGDEMDDSIKRLKYTRYADDFLIGVIGSFEDASEIKEKFRVFLEDTLHLEMSEEKTKITHSQDKARFLGYDITTAKNSALKYDSKHQLRKTHTGRIKLYAPRDKWQGKLTEYGALRIRYDKNGKEIWDSHHRGNMVHMTDVEIVSQVNAEIRGMYNYYSIAENATVIKNFAFILEYSMYKTFGLKYRKSVYKIQRKYRKNGIFMVPYNTKKGLRYCEFYHDGFKKKRYACGFEPDLLPQYVKYDNPNYLRTRIKLGVCELCGENTGDICMHHVRSLKSIQADNEWNTIMLAKRRKTLAVCPNCYAKITK
mgnify:CR=1 FL=1